MSSVHPGRLDLSTEVVEARGARVAIVRAEGEVDLGSAAELASALESATRADCEGIALDLTGVPFMDSSGLRTLLATSERTALVLVIHPGSPVARLLELTNLEGRIPAFSAEGPAVDSVVDDSGREP